MDGFSIREAARDYCSLPTWRRRIPISLWLPSYGLLYLVHDLLAGLTVALTVLPQGLAYANIAKLPVQYGLYSAYMGCFVYCFLGTSKDVSVGPTAIMSLLVATFGKPDADNPLLHDPTYAILLAFFAGAVQLLLGVLHLGALTSFISAGVIAGFTSISAVTIGFGQVKHILGLHFSSETFFDDVLHTFENIKYTNPWDLLIGLSSAAILLIFQWLKKSEMRWESDDSYTPSRGQRWVWKFLWLLSTGRNAVVVIMTALIAWTLDTQGLAGKVTVTGPVKEGLPPFQLPNFGRSDFLSILELGIVMVPLIGFLETIAIGKSFGRQNNYKVEPNQELVALGVGNIAGSFLSAYPMTGSFSRTAINSQSGVKTPAAGLVTGGVVILALSFLTPAFYYIPKSSLAAVIIVAVLQMVNCRIILTLWRLRKVELLSFTATCVASMFLGVAYGTAVGILVDLVIVMYFVARPGLKMVKPLSGQLEEPLNGQTDLQMRSSSAVVIQVDSNMYFPANDYIVDVLSSKLTEKDFPQCVILDLSCVPGLDYTMLEGLRDSIKDFRKVDAELLIASPKPSVKALMERAEVAGLSIHATVQDALKSLEEREGVYGV